ncbi:hypothetical protein IAU60_000413 [Kwoniella sp. DSM 27419]
MWTELTTDAIPPVKVPSEHETFYEAKYSCFQSDDRSQFRIVVEQPDKTAHRYGLVGRSTEEGEDLDESLKSTITIADVIHGAIVPSAVPSADASFAEQLEKHEQPLVAGENTTVVLQAPPGSVFTLQHYGDFYELPHKVRRLLITNSPAVYWDSGKGAIVTDHVVEDVQVDIQYTENTEGTGSPYKLRTVTTWTGRRPVI